MPAGVKERVRCVINSRNRLNPLTETSDNFTVTLNSSLTRIADIEIERVEIPYSFYTINSSNNVLTFNSGANSITITPGNYTANNLITEMKTQLNVTFAGQNPNVTFSPITYKLTITKTAAFTVDSSSSVPTSTASYVLGFRVSSASSTSVTADSVLNISGPNYILISSKYLTNGIYHKTLFSNASYQSVFWAVPVNCSPGSTIIESPSMPIHLNSKVSLSPADVIDFQLTDDTNNPISLNGLDWAMQMIFIIE